MRFSLLWRSAALCLGISLLLSSCSDPVAPVTTPKNGENAVLIVCEGLFGSDNATLSRYDVKSAQMDAHWFAANNNNQKLGSIANDIVTKGDTAFIAVADSKAIEVVNIKTGKSLGRIIFKDNEYPRSITLLNNSLACASLYKGDGVRFFNPTTFDTLAFVATGPSTEGIASSGNLVFVANSGSGDFRATEPGAGTISVIDATTKNIVKTINAGPNVVELKTSADGKKLYAYYDHFFSKRKDSLQGVIEYDVASMNELRRWRMRGAGSMLIHNNALYLRNLNPFVHDTILQKTTAILKIDLNASAPTVEQHIALDINTIIECYGFGINPADGHFWIADVKTYTINGEVFELSASGAILRRMNVGVNPKRFYFY